MKVLKDLQEKEEEDMESQGTFGNVKFLVIFFFFRSWGFSRKGRVGTSLFFFYLGGGGCKTYFFSGGCCQISI